MYYKGTPIERVNEYVLRMQGVATAVDPLGPFTKSPWNPVLNSGHETCLWPWQGGIAALVSLDGPEKNTIQYASNGVNFQIMSIIQMPPIAPGPFIPDAFADTGDGRGWTWGLCHINPDGGGATSVSILARFDCDLSQDVDRPMFKRNNLRFGAGTYFQPPHGSSSLIPVDTNWEIKYLGQTVVQAELPPRLLLRVLHITTPRHYTNHFHLECRSTRAFLVWSYNPPIVPSTRFKNCVCGHVSETF